MSIAAVNIEIFVFLHGVDIARRGTIKYTHATFTLKVLSNFISCGHAHFTSCVLCMMYRLSMSPL